MDLQKKLAESENEINRLQAELSRTWDWAMEINAHPIKTFLIREKRKIIYKCSRVLQKLGSLIYKFYCLVPMYFRFSFNQKNTCLVLSSSRLLPWIINDQNSKNTKLRDVLHFSFDLFDENDLEQKETVKNFIKNNQRFFWIFPKTAEGNVYGYQIRQIQNLENGYCVELHLTNHISIIASLPNHKEFIFLRSSLATLLWDYKIRSSVSLIDHANWLPLAKCVPNTYRVYGSGVVDNSPDDSDHYSTNNASQNFLKVNSFDYSLKEEINTEPSQAREDVPYIQFEPLIDGIRGEINLLESNRKIIGLWTSTSKDFNESTILSLAKAFPEELFVCLGKSDRKIENAVRYNANLEFIDIDKITDLDYLKRLDLCIFFDDVRERQSTRKQSLIRKFLAEDKFVICFGSSNLEELKGHIIRVESNHQLLEALQNILGSGSAKKHEEKNKQKELESSGCYQRYNEIQKRIKAIALPRVSVIILTFNNLVLTKNCLTSVIQRSNYENLEIIVVDNASTDGTIDYLTGFQRHHSSVKIIANRYNVGFAAGNNLGLAAATGEYLVLLNNDTVVTEGWVLTMLHHLMDHSDIGLLGAVTNHIGNEAQVEVDYDSLDQMPERSRAYTLTHMGELLFLRTVAFFCVMMPRSTYARCGPISEEYGVGFFEDDDYCRKVEKLGLKIACAEDVFIHHHLSASFNKLREKERRALFDRNRAIYEKKWGPWIPHRYRY